MQNIHNESKLQINEEGVVYIFIIHQQQKIDIYPATIIHKEYNRNIKSHFTGILLHLIAKQIPTSVNLSESEENDLSCKLDNERENREKSASQRIQYFRDKNLIPKYCFFNQTGFPSTGGKAHERIWKDKLTITESISYENKLEIFNRALSL